MRLIISCVAQHNISPSSKPLQVCKDCRHFQKPKCKLFGVQDLVDGSINYDNASIAREYKCKGEYFEARQNYITDLLKMYDIDLDAPRTYDK